MVKGVFKKHKREESDGPETFDFHFKSEFSKKTSLLQARGLTFLEVEVIASE